MATRRFTKLVTSCCRSGFVPSLFLNKTSASRSIQVLVRARLFEACTFSTCDTLNKHRDDQNGDEKHASVDRHEEELHKTKHDKKDTAKNSSSPSFDSRRLQKPIPRRAVMYVPGNDLRKLEKVRQLNNLDSVVLDHEDGVAETAKEKARRTIHKVLDDAAFFAERYQLEKDIGVRINSVSLHGERALEDLRSTLHARMLPTSLFLPKVEHEEEVQWVLEHTWTILRERTPPNSKMPSLRFVLYIESANALLRANKICKKALSFIEKKQPATSGRPLISLDALVFGADDFVADIGARKTATADECLYARQHLVAVAKAHRLQVIDMVWIDYKDVEGLIKQASEGRQFGFTGKQIIHPSQIEPVQAAFSPSPNQIEWAQALLAAYNEHNTSGRGAFTFRDKMIDRPLVLQARNILAITKSTDLQK